MAIHMEMAGMQRPKNQTFCNTREMTLFTIHLATLREPNCLIACSLDVRPVSCNRGQPNAVRSACIEARKFDCTTQRVILVKIPVKKRTLIDNNGSGMDQVICIDH